MNTTQSNVVGNKTARSCDSCSSRRAIWFCAADDAFLCQSCDTSVHSANQLARRHERVRLEKAPPSISSSSLAWHQGITKKLRTPRSRKRLQKQHDDGDDSNVEAVLVPEFTSEESFSPNDQNEEQYRVPVLDLLEEGEISNGFDVVIGKDTEFDLDSLLNEHEVSTMNLFPEFMETDVVELQDYLGTKTGEDSCKGLSSELGFEGGLKVEEDNYQDDYYCNSLGLEMAAGESSNWDFEEETDFYGDPVGLEMTRDQSLNWDFEGDYSSSPPRVEEKEVREKEKRRINLKLNHEAIIYAWDCQDSPWMNGIKPDFNLVDDHCWFDFMGGGCTLIDEDPNGAKSGRSGSGSGSGRFDEEREARVLRYKEKRRTRLFAKKIRYQVRKLNAEKRPRMKGRFVKRSAMAAPPSSSLPCYMQMNKQTMM